MTIKRLKFCINNEWTESATSKYMPVMNPSLGVQIAEAPCCTQSEVDAAVKAAAMTEEVAHTMWAAKQLGDIIPISQEDIDSLNDRYTNVYGQH